MGGAGDSTVIGSGETLSLLGASLLNGWMITAATICDTYVPAHVHITPEIVPPALGIAEQDRLDGKALLGAIAIGAEVAVRVAIGIDYSVAGP
ncbi:MAG: MmgE/PrpD family protein, partial [Alphaproteobacteria bacterium]|nr:MmgE/PrpD family protein [Alphaproteobacteria bacterium]